MHRIDTSTAQIDKFGQGKNGFTNGDPATGRRATDLNSDMWDAVQEEIANAIEGASITLDKTKHNQLYLAIQKAITDKGYLQKTQNLDDLQDKFKARNNLGLGGLAIKEIGYIFDSIYPVGIVTWFAQNKDPNALFPGTTWNYIGENRTVRLARASGDDIMTTGGADSVTLNNGNMPVHNHSFYADTSWFDYGTKWTSTDGAHGHGLDVRVSNVASETASFSDVVKTGGGTRFYTSVDGNHSHSVGIGGHGHSVSGTTGNSGSGTAFSIVNPYVKLMGWYRSA